MGRSKPLRILVATTTPWIMGRKKKSATRIIWFPSFFFFSFSFRLFPGGSCVCVHSLCTHACGSMKRRFDDGAVRGKLIRNETKQKYGHQKRITHKYTHTHYRAHLPPPSLSLGVIMSVAPIRWNYKITTNWHDCLSPSLTPSHGGGGGCPIGPHSGPSYMYDVIVIDFLYIFFSLCVL
jgi:hypothetical protein